MHGPLNVELQYLASLQVNNFWNEFSPPVMINLLALELFFF